MKILGFMKSYLIHHEKITIVLQVNKTIKIMEKSAKYNNCKYILGHILYEITSFTANAETFSRN